MNTTVRMKASQIYKDWHVIDAAGRPLGRVASEAAILLRGKHKPTYEPHLDDGDFVIIVNAAEVRVTGRKSEQIKYHTHSGYPGGLRTRSFAEQFARFPDRVVEDAVKGMLPGGPLGEAMARHLKVYAGPTHPHQSQIAGSQKAQAARAAGAAALVTVVPKPPRLRPLSVPEAPAAVAEHVVEAPAPAPAPKPARARAPKPAEAPVEEVKEAPAPPVAEAPTVEAPAPKPRAPRKKAEPAAEAPAAGAAEAEATARKPRATRKKVDAAVEAPAVEEKKPTRRRSAAKTEE